MLLDLGAVLGAQSFAQGRQIPRGEVRAILLRLLFTAADRAALQAQYARLAGKPGGAGWDNPGR